MTMVINEWQLNGKLNRALQNSQRADFALYLAWLTPAVDESAEFFTPQAVTERIEQNLLQQLGVQQARAFCQTETDIDLMQQHSVALRQGGLAQLKLATYLNQPPLTQYDNKTRLGDDIWQSLSLHSRRRLQQSTPDRPEANPAGLYEVLQQLHGMSAA
ncbi:VC2046/SO_2500 family protein [Rheinheimera sp. NSM]|uniref:VC2046/SO_2500 family protein n=1 Tax=Rheinheimera sp. NSM TaxID=3457884 RepID=UPI004035923A